MPRRSKVHELPTELKEWLDAELIKRGFGDYVQLAADLKARGADVSKSALQRYGSPFERRMDQLKVATEQARAIVDSAPDDEDKLGAALMRMTQEKIFGMLLELDIDVQEVDVNKLFKNAAEIGKASVAHKKFGFEARAALKEEARRELIAEQRAKLYELGQSGEIDQEMLAKVIKAAYGL